jgi:hypothetical protein
LVLELVVVPGDEVGVGEDGHVAERRIVVDDVGEVDHGFVAFVAGQDVGRDGGVDDVDGAGDVRGTGGEVAGPEGFFVVFAAEDEGEGCVGVEGGV